MEGARTVCKTCEHPIQPGETHVKTDVDTCRIYGHVDTRLRGQP